MTPSRCLSISYYFSGDILGEEEMTLKENILYNIEMKQIHRKKINEQVPSRSNKLPIRQTLCNP